MSLRYPTMQRTPWLPQPLTVFVATGRDLYGNVTTAATGIQTTGRIKRMKIEVMESGARALADGATIYMAVIPNVTLDVGTIIRSNGVDYMVQTMNDRQDSTGNTLAVELRCTVKPTEKVPA